MKPAHLLTALAVFWLAACEAPAPEPEISDRPLHMQWGGMVSYFANDIPQLDVPAASIRIGPDAPLDGGASHPDFIIVGAWIGPGSTSVFGRVDVTVNQTAAHRAGERVRLVGADGSMFELAISRDGPPGGFGDLDIVEPGERCAFEDQDCLVSGAGAERRAHAIALIDFLAAHELVVLAIDGLPERELIIAPMPPAVRDMFARMRAMTIHDDSADVFRQLGHDAEIGEIEQGTLSYDGADVMFQGAISGYADGETIRSEDLDIRTSRPGD